jgi:hypothetical protein
MGYPPQIPRQFLARIVHNIDWRIEMKTLQKTSMAVAMQQAGLTSSLAVASEAQVSLSIPLSVETATEFLVTGAKGLQSQARQLRLWACPNLDPESDESRNIAGESLDSAIRPIFLALCQARVSRAGLAVGSYWESNLQSVLRNTWPSLKAKGAGVSVRFMVCPVDEDGYPTKSGIKTTTAFLDCPSVSWSRIGQDSNGSKTMAYFASISWKQSKPEDVLDPIMEVKASPGGEDPSPRSAREVEHENEYSPRAAGFEPRVDLAYTPEHVAKMLHSRIDPLREWMLANVQCAKLRDADLFIGLV